MRSPAKHTTRFLDFRLDDIRAGELVILASDATENRGQLPVWAELSANSPGRVARIAVTGGESCSISIATGSEAEVLLRDEAAVRAALPSDEWLIDISGMSHPVWASVVRAAYLAKVRTRVLYAEPDSYRLHSSPASATQFDLSVTFEGVSPLPGFANLTGPAKDQPCVFVAALGFEGNRPECLVLQIEPTPKVVPIVGVPGFQMEFPAFTVACNRGFLEDYGAHSEIRYARASCPFEAMEQLREIGKDNPGAYLYLAPIGTKPHALGVVLFALRNPDSTEILFDHPVRKAGRTKGVGVIHVFDFGGFDEL